MPIHGPAAKPASVIHRDLMLSHLSRHALESTHSINGLRQARTPVDTSHPIRAPRPAVPGNSGLHVYPTSRAARYAGCSPAQFAPTESARNRPRLDRAIAALWRSATARGDFSASRQSRDPSTTSPSARENRTLTGQRTAQHQVRTRSGQLPRRSHQQDRPDPSPATSTPRHPAPHAAASSRQSAPSSPPTGSTSVHTWHASDSSAAISIPRTQVLARSYDRLHQPVQVDLGRNRPTSLRSLSAQRLSATPCILRNAIPDARPVRGHALIARRHCSPPAIAGVLSR